MSNQIKIKPIDLQTIALKLLNNERIVSELANGERVITAEELSSKIPMLKSLGKMPLIQLRATETGNNYLIPSIYQKDEQNVIILPDINASITKDSQAKSRKDKIRTITRVFLEPIDGADFSDF